MNLPYSSVASANTLIGIHVGIGEGGIIVTFWSAWNVMLFKTPEINKYIYIYIYKRLKWFVKQHQVHKTK
jgi:hypothetical protein